MSGLGQEILPTQNEEAMQEWNVKKCYLRLFLTLSSKKGLVMFTSEMLQSCIEVLEILKTLIVLYTAILVITMVFIGGFVSLVTKEN